MQKKLWRSKNEDGDKKIEDAGAFIVNVIIHSYCLTKQFEILSWNVGNSFGGKIGLQNHVHIIDDVFVHFWRSLSWNFAFGKHFWTLQNKKKEIKNQFRWPMFILLDKNKFNYGWPRFMLVKGLLILFWKNGWIEKVCFRSGKHFSSLYELLQVSTRPVLNSLFRNSGQDW